ncbi:MAG: T9SS type A sorting domain-containing protein, partial [Fluviicola sp.]|nr:T9SS type A sorting domain-containing protein [Fluviicola sp.]
FAIYFGSSWMGSLTQMCAGKGYVTELTNNSTLNYPSNSKNSEAPDQNVLTSPEGIDISTTLKQHNMNMVASVFNAAGEKLDQKEMILLAFHENECRGIVEMDLGNNGLMFLTIGSNNEFGELITFKVWLPDLAQMLDIRENLFFESYKLLGAPDQPFKLTTYAVTGLDNTPANTGILIGDPHPNPFTQSTIIDYSVNGASQLELSIFDGLGQKAYSQTIRNTEKGTYQLIIPRNNLKAGVYSFRITVNNLGKETYKSGKLVVH